MKLLEFNRILNCYKFSARLLTKSVTVISIVILLIFNTADKANAKSNLLDKLEMSSNYNTPEVWEDQLGSYATGGSIYARTPRSELQLLSFDMPSFDAGCGGININYGGFGYISGKQIETMVKQIGSNALSYTVMLTIKSISPQIADLLENLEAMARFMNAQNINSCQLGASIASGMFPRNEQSQRLGCQARKMGGNMGGIGDQLSSYFTARETCNDGQKVNEINNEDKDKDKPLLPAEYNLVWYALKKEAANLPKDDKEFLMSLSGTILSLKSKGDSISFKHKPSLMRSSGMLNTIIFGGEDKGFKLYSCDKVEDCLHPTEVNQVWNNKDSMHSKVISIMQSMEEKIMAESKGDNVSLDAKEKDLLSRTSLPIFNLISLHVATKGHGARFSVEDYAETLAFDYTIGYLDSLVDFVYQAIGNLEHAQIEGDVIKEFKEEIRAIKLDLFHERSKAMNRLYNIQSVKQSTRQIESQVYSMFADYRDVRDK